MKIPKLDNPELGLQQPEPGLYEVTIFESQDIEFQDGRPAIKWQLRIAEGKFEGQMLSLRTAVPSKWLRWLTETISLDIKKGHTPDEYYGKRLQVQVVHQDYQGEPRASINKLVPSLKKEKGKGKGKEEEPF